MNPALEAVFDAAARGTFILLAALGATALMRRSSAAARHLVWLAALTGVLLLPAARGLMPEWRVVPVPAAARGSWTPPPVASTQPRPQAPSVAAGPMVVAETQAPLDWARLALLLWAAGAALMAARLLYGVARVRWIAARAEELTDDSWIRLTDGLARRLGLGRIVRLLRGSGASVPMTWGVFSPVILLPGESDGWDEQRRRVVLSHELAHVRRWDALTQWIAHLAVAVFWFNPLVWIAARKLREEREHACDDAVLEAGARPSDYADTLLTLVRSLGSSEGNVAALAMARRSQFEGRLLAILDSAVRRNGVTRVAAMATIAAAAACVLPLAALRAVEPAAAAEIASAEAMAGPSSSAPSETGETAVQDAPRVPGREAAEPRAPNRDAAIGTEPAQPPTLSGTSRDELVQAAAAGDPRLYDEIIRAAEEIRSANSRRMVLMELLHRADLSLDNLARIIGATRTMDSDTERRLVLADAVRHRALGGHDLPDTFAPAMAAMAASTESRIILQIVLERARLSQRDLVTVFRLVPRLGNGVDRRLVLVSAADRHRLEPAARDAYMAAARSIPTDSDRGLALQALVGRAERPARATSAGGTAQERGYEADIILTLEGGRRIFVDAKKVFLTRDLHIRRIERGGRLVVEERRSDGDTCRIEAVPGRDGQLVVTYRRNGQVMPVTETERNWMAEIIREVSGL